MKRHLPLVGLCLAVFLVMTGMGAAAVALPEKYLQASGSMGASGWLASAFAVSYMLVQVPAGRWADRHGYRPLLVLGCVLIAGAALIFSLAATATAIYAGRFVQGMGEAPVWALAPALLGRLYPAMRGRAMGLYNAAFHLGLMLGPVVGAWAAARAGLDPFLFFMGASLGAAMLVFVAVPGGAAADCEVVAGGSGDEAAGHWAGVLQRLWPVLAGVPLFGAAYGLLVSCLPVHLTGELELSPSRLGAVLFAAYAGIAAGQMAGGALSDRFGRMGFVVGGLLAMGAGLLGFTLAVVSPVAAGAILGLGLGLFGVASMALVNEAAGANREGLGSSLYFLAWGMGYFAGPLWVNLAGLQPGGAVIAAGAFAAAVLGVGARSRVLRKE